MIKIQEYDFFIFDCDGVILNSNSIKNFAFRLTLKNENKDLVDSFIKYHKENGGISRYEKFQHFFKNMKKSNNYKREVSEALERFSTILKIDLINAEYVPGILNFLNEIKKIKKNIYIVSGGDEKELEFVFNARGISHFFKNIYGSPTEKNKNTLFVLKNYSKKSKGVFFGDSKIDFKCAINNNLDFVFVKKFSEWKNFSRYQDRFLCITNDFIEQKYKK